MTRDRLGVAALTAGAALLHALLGLQQYWRYRIGAYDLVIFDQAVRGYAGLGAPVSPLKGVHNDFGPDFSVLGDHVSPVLALLAPLYWVADSPVTLLLAQAALFAGAVPLVWVLTARRLGPALAYAVAGAFALSWPLVEATAVGFHEVAFAVPLTLLALERAQAGRWGQGGLAAAGLLLVKEDMGLVVAAFGLLAALRGRRLLGAGMLAAGLLAVVVAVRIVIPAAGGRADYYWSYDALGPDAPSALAYVLGHPLDAARLLGTPEVKARTLALLALPLGGLCLLSPVSLLAVPLLLERMWSANPNHWGSVGHYNAFVLPALTVAAVEVAARLPRRWAGRWALGTVAVALGLLATTPAAALADPGAWRPGVRERAAAEAVAAVPDGGTGEADNQLGPHLTARADVRLLDRTPRGAPWVVADTARRSFPFDTVEQVRARVAALRAGGYTVVLERGGYVVLRRGGR